MHLRDAYRGKRVLVTGDTGFKGSWLAIWLRELGAEVSGLSLPPRSPRDNYAVTGLADRITHVDIDVRDADAVVVAVEEARPEIVFHLAAQPLVLAGYAAPRETFDTNVMGTVNVLDALRRVSTARAIVIVTSDKCYANPDQAPRRETDELGGSDPYSASKAAAELVTAAMRQSFFAGQSAAAIATTRAGNVIGGGDWSADRLIPDGLRAWEASRALVLRNPHAVRPWQFVLDALHGYLLLGARLTRDGAAFASAWNFGPAERDMVPVLQVVEAMIAAWGSGTYQVDIDPAAAPEASHLRLASTKANQRLGWWPRLELAQGIAWTADGYRAELADGVLDHRVGQIRAFEVLS